MSDINAKNLYFPAQFRELLLSGEYNNLFSNLTLNLPRRFYAYANPESLNPLFQKTYTELTSTARQINGNDAWAFDDIQNILMPPERAMDFSHAITFLTRTCKIPEKHIYIKNGPIANELFPNRRIYLSRYAMCLVVKSLMSTLKSFKYDCATPLFRVAGVSDNTPAGKFSDEMRYAFAAYFFAFPQTDLNEMIDITWMWVRGIRLKNAYESANNNLRYLMQKIYGPEFDFHKYEEFKQSFIFDTMFYSPSRGNFATQYQNMLMQMGYELKSTRRDEALKWRKANKVAPKYPGAFFAPHVSFLMIWLLGHFDKFISNENISGKNKVKIFQDLTRRFFNTISGALAAQKYQNKNSDHDFLNAPLFVNQHHSDAYKIIRAIKSGTGPTITDSESGKKIRENPSALEFFQNNHLFCDDDMWCLKYRHTKEKTLAALHAKYAQNPSIYLAHEIQDQENKIAYENVSLYGINLSAFVSVPQILNNDGTFIARPCIGPENISDYFRLPKTVNGTTVPNQQLEFKFIGELNPPAPYSEFTIIQPTTIPASIPFTRGVNKTTGRPYVIYDINGEFESVNPAVKNPFVLDINGNPKNADVNFEQISFLLESDTLPANEQLAQAHRLAALGVINRVVFSGNKSYHMRCTVATPPENKAERKWLFNHIIQKYDIRGIDPVCWNNGRMMRRPNAFRQINGNSIQQQLIHQTNDILKINWRPLYNEYQHRRQEYIKKLPPIDGINEKLVNRVKIMLATWYDGNRHNLLDQGLIPMMYYAGWTPNEIRNTLCGENTNRNLQRTIEQYIANIR